MAISGLPTNRQPYPRQWNPNSMGTMGMGTIGMSGYTPLRLLYHNDGEEDWSSMARLVTAYRDQRQAAEQQGADVLCLTTGDNTLGPEPQESHLVQWLTGLMGVDYQTPGNHELDGGFRNWLNSLSQTPMGKGVKTLVSNWRMPPTASTAPGVFASDIHRGHHGTSYGVIGVGTPALHRLVDGKAPLEGLQSLDLDQTIAQVQEEVRRLEAQGVRQIVVLSHMGFEEDQQLAQKVRGIDIIVGGHSKHEQVGVHPGTNWLKSPSGEPVLLLHGGEASKWFGMADVLFDTQGRVIPVANTLHAPSQWQPDPTALAGIQNVLGPERPVAVLAQGASFDNAHRRPDPVLQSVADSVRQATGADIALINSNALRHQVAPGLLTDRTLKTIMPFPDKAIVVPMKGQQLLAALTRCAQAVQGNRPYPGLLHPSGFAYEIQQTIGQVLNPQVWNAFERRWEPLQPNQMYRVAVEEHLLSNPKKFPEWEGLGAYGQGSALVIRDIFAQYLRTLQSHQPHQPIAFSVDGRLRVS